jgi:hypothetical protein
MMLAVEGSDRDVEMGDRLATTSAGGSSSQSCFVRYPAQAVTASVAPNTSLGAGQIRPWQ